MIWSRDSWDHAAVRRARALAMMEAVEHAGLAPIPLLHFHALAFLGNVLSPIWSLLPQRRSVLRRRGGPYYPELQDDVDALIGAGMIGIEELAHVLDDDEQWRLEGRFFLCFDRAHIILESLRSFEDERRLHQFFRELAFAMSTLTEADRARAIAEDATYGDPRVGEGAIIDFAEWKRANYSENAARSFDHVMPTGKAASPAEKLHLYTRHLKRRLAVG